MWQLAVLVLDNPSLVEEIVSAWESEGVRGATLLNSSGMARRRGLLGDDVPLFPSLAELVEEGTHQHVTLFALVDDAVDIQRLADRTERITGDLTQPSTGVFFVLPVSYARGVRPPA